MPQPRRTTSRRTTSASQKRRVERFNKSLDAAQKALKDLRSDVGTGAKDVYSNLSKSLTQARRDGGKLARNLQRDVQQGAKRTASAARGRTAGGTSRRTTTRRASSGRSTTRRSTSGRSTARRSTARRSSSGRSSSRRSS
jgi:hypothetical protein